MYNREQQVSYVSSRDQWYGFENKKSLVRKVNPRAMQ